MNFNQESSFSKKERGLLATLELYIEEERLNLDDILFTIKSGLGFNFFNRHYT